MVLDMPDLRFTCYKIFFSVVLLPFINGCDSDQPVKKATQQVSVITITPETIETDRVLAGRTVASEVSQVRPLLMVFHLFSFKVLPQLVKVQGLQ